MLEGILRACAIAATVVIGVGFVLFALDELDSASDRQRSVLTDPDRTQERIRETEHSRARELVDDANDVLLKPFADVVRSGDPWVVRGVPTLLGLLVYGVGLGFLARYVRARA